MSIDAIAILRTSYSVVCQLRGLTPAPDYSGALQSTTPFAPLGEDGTACFIGMKFGAEPLELAAYLRTALGTLLDSHEDERGVFVVPHVGWQDSGYESYAAVIEAFGEAGEWIPCPSADSVRASSAESLRQIVGVSMANEIANLRSQLGDSFLGNAEAMKVQMDAVQDLFAKNPGAVETAMETVQEHLDTAVEAIKGSKATSGQSEITGGDLMDMAQQMLSKMTPDQQSKLEQMALAMFGGRSSDDDD